MYAHSIVLLSWRINHFINSQCPSLSLVILLILKSSLSDIKVATPLFFIFLFLCYLFFYPFTFNVSIPFYLKRISYIQPLCVSCLSKSNLYFILCFTNFMLNEIIIMVGLKSTNLLGVVYNICSMYLFPLFLCFLLSCVF